MKNRNGFSVVSTLVSLALMTFAMSAFSQMILSTEKAVQNLKRKNEFEETKIAIRSILQSPTLCPKALLGDDGVRRLKLDVANVPIRIPAFSNGSGTPYLDLRNFQTQRLASGLEVVNFEVSDAIFDGNYTLDTQNVRRYTVNLRLSARSPQGAYGAKSFQSTLVAQTFYLNNVGEVVACGLDVSANKVPASVVEIAAPTTEPETPKLGEASRSEHNTSPSKADDGDCDHKGKRS